MDLVLTRKGDDLYPASWVEQPAVLHEVLQDEPQIRADQHNPHQRQDACIQLSSSLPAVASGYSWPTELSQLSAVHSPGGTLQCVRSSMAMTCTCWSRYIEQRRMPSSSKPPGRMCLVARNKRNMISTRMGHANVSRLIWLSPLWGVDLLAMLRASLQGWPVSELNGPNDCHIETAGSCPVAEDMSCEEEGIWTSELKTQELAIRHWPNVFWSAMLVSSSRHTLHHEIWKCHQVIAGVRRGTTSPHSALTVCCSTPL